MATLVRIRTESGEETLELDELEARIRRGELAGRCPVCFPPLTGERWVRADQLELFRRLNEPRKLYFSRAFNLGRFPRLTALFIVLDVALYMVMRADGGIDQDALVGWGAKVAPLIVDLGQLWRLVTANLLHQNGLHIAFNLFVLFNVGGALENAYRPLDYLLLLVASALGTTLVSLWALPEAVTAGASGIVYGAMGAAVVFGIKYRELLPERYRKVLGEATIPTVLVFLYIGFTSTGVDNWAHLGGLLSGALTALFLKPRLLMARAPDARSRLLRLAPLAAAGLAIWGGGAWLARRPLPTKAETDDNIGLQVGAPKLWWRGAEPAGALAFHNGLSGFGRASFTAGARDAPGGGLERAASQWIDEHLVAEERAGAISDTSISTPEPARLAGREALRIDGSYQQDGFVTRFRVFLVPRGELVYELVYQWPESYPAYERRIEELQEQVRLVEPRALREARERAGRKPSPGNLSLLADTLYRLGQPDAAAPVLEQLLRQDPENADALARLALAWLSAGRNEPGCQRAQEALEADPESVRAWEAMGSCRIAQGDRVDAARWLRRAADSPGSRPQLRDRLERLRKGLESKD